MTALLIIALITAIGLARRIVLDAERIRLVAEAEHELRGPLQAIALAVEGGAAVDLSDEVERARTALADLSAARSGMRSHSADQPLRLDRLVWRAATASDLAARRIGGRVHLDWRAGPVSVQANRGRLAQALSNLLSNAIEHGGGNVQITGRRTTRGVRIEVRDSGRGHGLSIAPKAVRDAGRGHGLSIASKAVREMGGSLGAARAGDGTVMTIELPVCGSDASPTDGPPSAHLRAGSPPLAESDPPAAA